MDFKREETFIKTKSLCDFEDLTQSRSFSEICRFDFCCSNVSFEFVYMLIARAFSSFEARPPQFLSDC